MKTYTSVLGRHDLVTPDHLEAQAEIPVTSGLSRQGDIIVVPQKPGVGLGEQVPPEGIPVVRGENGGNTHLLVADGAVTWRALSSSTQSLGVVDVAEGATAYLLHPEHGGQGFSAGSYVIRRQREMADQIRLVAD